MKDRGDTFFKRQDYGAAVNAYTAALSLDSTLSAVRPPPPPPGETAHFTNMYGIRPDVCLLSF